MNWAPEDYAIAGCRLAACEAGIRYANRKDLCMFAFDAGTVVAGVFTRNSFCAAPVQVCKRHLQSAAVRYLLINSGNANAGTGATGLERALACCEKVAAAGGCESSQVLPFSTGVIGEHLPLDPIEKAIPGLVANLKGMAWEEVSRAIMTTDTRPKLAHRRVNCGASQWRISGVAKGAGMIHPNMATMLGFIVSDAAVGAELATSWNRQLAELTFNRATVDGDTSTNDSCILAFTGQSGSAVIEQESDQGAAELKSALLELYCELAQAIVKDGEGATKFVTIEVSRGASEEECKDVAFSIAHSPLVKTALFASDPNWGRILAAIGNAGIADLDIDIINIRLDDTPLVRNGQRHPDYTEADGARIFAQAAFFIRVDLGRGSSSAEVWTTDLSHDYVKINAEYRS